MIVFITCFLILDSFGIQAAQVKSKSINSTSNKYQTPMHKVLFTQRGYIQFLRWELPVPEIDQFTFCVWVNSNNLTYPQSIFSYSKNEKDRLVRAWIAPQGQSIHLEINNIAIFNYPTSIKENQWYHICQSWENRRGRYGLWINGQIDLDDLAPEMAGHVIPKGGDIVLAQEYTDFNKGLEEGIEGAATGFNLLLASAFEDSTILFDSNHLGIGLPDISLIDLEPINREEKTIIGPALFPQSSSSSSSSSIGQYSLNPFTHEPVSFSRSNILRNKRVSPGSGNPSRNWQRRIQGFKTTSMPIGLQLIEDSYNHCEIGRGSPFIGGSRLIISWTRTPVKVFGGAILKNIDSQCGIFNAINN